MSLSFAGSNIEITSLQNNAVIYRKSALERTIKTKAAFKLSPSMLKRMGVKTKMIYFCIMVILSTVEVVIQSCVWPLTGKWYQSISKIIVIMNGLTSNDQPHPHHSPLNIIPFRNHILALCSFKCPSGQPISPNGNRCHDDNGLFTANDHSGVIRTKWQWWVSPKTMFPSLALMNVRTGNNFAAN